MILSLKRKPAGATIPVVGMCRFSYPALTGFNRTFDDPADLSAYLYDPARLELRFALFEALTVPTLAQQTDPDFTFIVLTGTDLPGAARDRLEAAVARIPGGRIERREPASWEIYSKILTEESDGSDKPVLQFRLDDDDAVSIKYIETLREVAAGMLPMLDQFDRLALDPCLGMSLVWDDRLRGAHRVLHQNTSQGLALLTRMNQQQTIMSFAHNIIYERVPMFSFTRAPMFLATRHMDQDSPRGSAPELKDPMTRDELARRLTNRFGLSLDVLEQIRLPQG